jgi:hypothetical protein
VISIPVGLHAPTLSFMYRIDDVDYVGILEIKLNQEAIFSASENTAGWEHGFVDLSAWAGKTFTLTVEAKDMPATQPGSVYVDDISLGSWLTPILSGVDKMHFPEWSDASLSVRGQNFLSGATIWLGDYPLDQTVWIDAQSLQATIPASVPPGIYDLSVFNPGGQESVQLKAIQLGTGVYLPVVQQR